MGIDGIQYAFTTHTYGEALEASFRVAMLHKEELHDGVCCA